MAKHKKNTTSVTSHTLSIHGARTHNLQNISVDLPKGQMIVFTGPSGSGKSSLAFDTLYAEGQRRYIDSLSSYARQFLDVMDKPDVDRIDGLTPAISIEQKTIAKNPRSTVGTVTEMYDYLGLLFARIGVPYSPTTGLPIQAQTRSQMVARILELPEKARFYIMAPIARHAKGSFQKELADLQKRGFQRVLVDGSIYDIDDVPPLARQKHHDIYVIVDRLVQDTSDNGQQRLAASIEIALVLGKGLVMVQRVDTDPNTSFMLSSHFSCPVSGFSVDELEPRLFSFNSPVGSCRQCGGIGVEQWGLEHINDRPFETLPTCDACKGYRLNDVALSIKIANCHIGQVCDLSIMDAQKWFDTMTKELSEHHKNISQRIIREIQTRLTFLNEVGLGYLTLSRNSLTLSGGESQRIRLASQVGSGLTGVLYVLDEPSIGLHQRDNDQLIATLKKLQNLGNTLIVVEHDEDTIRAADYIADFGPGAGRLGGTITACGTLNTLMNDANSVTGAYLSGRKTIAVPHHRRPPSDKKIVVHGAHIHNLKNVTAHFPLGLMVCVSGVSGSGKSSLVMNTVQEAIRAHMNGHSVTSYCTAIDGVDHIDQMIAINQDPIGRTPRSNPATYTGVFTPIREWFAMLPDAKAMGYGPGRFSFNVKGGRCEACEGNGTVTISMHFLPDMHVPCDACKGKRYNYDTLSVTYKDKSILDVLNMTVDEAIPFFDSIPSIVKKLTTLSDVGLGYLQIGQPATTLSGGEAQRIKLAKELCKRQTGRTLYIMDEPTTGLHFQDVEQLLKVLHRLVDHGNTMIIIEHNLEVIKTADWIIDIGPEGGHEGGSIVAEGTPETVVKNTHSHTGRFLKKIMHA